MAEDIGLSLLLAGNVDIDLPVPVQCLDEGNQKWVRDRGIKARQEVKHLPLLPRKLTQLGFLIGVTLMKKGNLNGYKPKP